jgi:rod shape determining protein RodA
MKNHLLKIDWMLLAPVFILVIISLVILYSINPSYSQGQIFSLGIALLVFILFSQIAYQDYSKLYIPLYLLYIFLLITVLIIGIESRGAVRWLDLFGVSLQASEIGKPIISLVLAGFLQTHSNKSYKTYFYSILLILPVVVLIYLQPDLGNALIYISVFMTALIIYGIPLFWILLTTLPFVALMPFLWGLIHDYQRQRFLTFLNPLRDPSGNSYNLIQAIIAVGSGMIVGKGVLESTQSRLKFLPENHTDFIFASLAEKLGFLGSIIVVVVFIVLFYRIYQIFINSKDLFGKMYSAISLLFLLFQFFINIGMNLGVVPVVGITLPFLSLGGSSLVANFLMLGILSSISISSEKKEVLEIR